MRCERGRLFADNDAPDWWVPGCYVSCFKNGNNAGSIICMRVNKFKPGASKISDGLSIYVNTKLFMTGRYIVEKSDGDSIALFYERPDQSAETAEQAQKKAEQYTQDIGVNLDTVVEKEAFLKKIIWETYTGKLSPKVMTAVSKAVEYLIDNHDIIHRQIEPTEQIDYKTELERLIRSSATTDSAKLNAIRDLIKRGEAGGEDNSEKRVRRQVLIKHDDGD